MRTIVTIKNGDIIVTTKKGDVSFYKMYQDLEKKTDKANIAAWVGIGFAVALVVPVSISQLSLNEIKEQTATIEKQDADIKEQRDLIYELNNKVHELEKQIIKQPK
jgi:hypothetical protein